jgi:uncharacterized protein
VPGLGASVTARLGLLAAALRAGGVRVGLGELLGAHRALAAVAPESSDQAYYALRAALCSRRQDLPVFDGAFLAVFGGGAPPLPPPPALPRAEGDALSRAAPPAPPPAPQGPERADLEPEPVPAAWSDEELLREKDFAEYTDAERALARMLVARIARRGPMRLSRRTRPTRRRGEAHDLRRTMRASLRYGGEPLERRWRTSTERFRPLVLVCDVSGSMAPYARMLMQYMQAAVAARRRVEGFVFGTRLTRVTHELSGRDPDRALERASGAVLDWSGGTRIGDALAELNRAHGRRLGRGAVVVILSDGWDRGDPEALAAEMARLGRSAHSLVWLNPLKAHPGYEPLTRGMQAALPHVDHFLAGNSIRSLEQLAEILETGSGASASGARRGAAFARPQRGETE